MPLVAVVVAVVEAGRVLLTRRADLAVWCLPGGAVEPGEWLTQVAEASEASEGDDLAAPRRSVMVAPR